jgi:hypothetical protein
MCRNLDMLSLFLLCGIVTPERKVSLGLKVLILGRKEG